MRARTHTLLSCSAPAKVGNSLNADIGTRQLVPHPVDLIINMHI
uniref:Uncharacterized protein n=1 Tax=Anguilla anguilla TaxID=7936 RepID=A0A0E9U851_ANGAN